MTCKLCSCQRVARCAGSLSPDQVHHADSGPRPPGARLKELGSTSRMCMPGPSMPRTASSRSSWCCRQGTGSRGGGRGAAVGGRRQGAGNGSAAGQLRQALEGHPVSAPALSVTAAIRLSTATHALAHTLHPTTPTTHAGAVEADEVHQAVVDAGRQAKGGRQVVPPAVHASRAWVGGRLYRLRGRKRRGG